MKDKTFKTTTLDITGANATAKVTLTLNDAFKAWQKLASGVGTTGPNNSFLQINEKGYANGGTISAVITTIGGATQSTTLTNRFITSKGAFAWGTGTSVLTPGGVELKGNFTTGFSGKESVLVRTSESKVVSTPNALTVNELYWSTLQRRNLLTLTTTVFNPVNYISTESGTTTANSSTAKITGKFGVNNVSRTFDDYKTGRGELIVKIQVSDSATAKATKALDTVVKRTTIFGTELPVSTCPDFPSASQAFGNLDAFMVDGQAKAG